MKKYMGGCLMLLVALSALPLSYPHPVAYLLNTVPALLWGLWLLLRSRKEPGVRPVLLGVCYGVFGAVLAISTLALLVDVMFREPALGKNPYDTMACGILSVLSLVGLLALLVWDLWKQQDQRIGDRIMTAAVVFLPAVRMILPILAYFEGMLSQYVS